VGSSILDLQPALKDTELYRSLRIVTDVEGTLVPRNAGLLFFNEHPERFFPGCVFDVVQFADDAGGNLIEERRFSGPVDTQITAVLDHLDTMTNVQIRKLPGKAAVERSVAFPYEALEEAIANAAYHRSYENPEPNKVYLYPDRLEIISYPGPVPGITLKHLAGDNPIPPVPARNRRIGEFLKELKLAEMRGTGIPRIRRAMSQNGSSAPTIDFDPDRTYFRVLLPAHPRYQALHALREGAYLWSIGEKRAAIDRLSVVFNQQPESGAIAASLIEYLSDMGEVAAADEVFRKFASSPLKHEVEQPYLRICKIRLNRQDRSGAKQAIDSMPESGYANAPLDVAIQYKRIRENDRAHTILSRVFSTHDGNPEYLHQFAQVKMAIANDMARKQRNPQWLTIRRLRQEAVELLRRALTVSNDRTQRAWCNFDLARTMSLLKTPNAPIREAFEAAIDLIPGESAFHEAYERWKLQGRRTR
jgi:ATP-dependent DNA helicase RecG